MLLGSWFGLIGLLVGLANGWCAGCGVFGFWVLRRISGSLALWFGKGLVVAALWLWLWRWRLIF